MASKMIKLKSSDGGTFDVDFETAKCSTMIKTMLDNLGDEGLDEPLPLFNVKSDVLSKVITWLEHHKGDGKPQEEDNQKRVKMELTNWDEEFLQLELAPLCQLMLAANYLDIKGLLDHTCKMICSKIRGKSPFEIKQFFRPARRGESSSSADQVTRLNESEL